jgi:hypothetical protein
MDADEIVTHHVQHDGVSMVFDLLRKCIREPSEATHVHSHREIPALGRCIQRLGINERPNLIYLKVDGKSWRGCLIQTETLPQGRVVSQFEIGI